jgi:hypothetical protein
MANGRHNNGPTIGQQARRTIGTAMLREQVEVAV